LLQFAKQQQKNWITATLTALVVTSINPAYVLSQRLRQKRKLNQFSSIQT